MIITRQIIEATPKPLTLLIETLGQPLDVFEHRVKTEFTKNLVEQTLSNKSDCPWKLGRL